VTKSAWRLAAGGIILSALVLAAVFLAPSYIRNIRLQQFLADMVQQPETYDIPPAMVQARVANAAAQLGIPVSPSQVKVTREGNSLLIEVRYFVRVDLPLYTVDLHFRARGGGR
jgi:hypothetical protein